MISRLLEFWSFTNPHLNLVLTATILLAVLSATVGTFTALQKKSLVGDVLAHASLPGITTAFLIIQERNITVLLIAGVLSALFGMFMINVLIKIYRVRHDSALTIVLSSFFALGLFHLSIIQSNSNSAQAGIDRLLFGQAAAILPSDLRVILLLAALVLISLCLFYHKFVMLCFDPIFAKTTIKSINFYDFLLTLLTAFTVVLGIQLVGIVLMAAFLITPYAAAKYWSDNLKKILLIAATFSLIASLFGANISYLYPRMPSGPWIVVILSVIFFISVSLAPKKGLIILWTRARATSRRIAEENIIRILYKFAEAAGKKQTQYSELLEQTELSSSKLRAVLHSLQKKRLIKVKQVDIQLSASGHKKAEELTRYHRIWEVYLQNKMNIAHDHLHDDAEEMEHWITKEIEREILEELGEIGVDPHGSRIPASEEKK